MNRLDVALFRAGLVRSREQAQRLIKAGQVMVNGQPVRKASAVVSPEAALAVAVPERFVSRGGLKLEAALDHFGIEVTGRRCLDLGISTGGFTDCLLQRGAAAVVGIDVGHGQTADSVRYDHRVTVVEGINARELLPEKVGGTFDLMVMDLSFIAAAKVVPVLDALAKPGADLVILVKPQFELDAGRVGKGGIVKDPAAWAEAVARVENALRIAGVWETFPVWASPVPGTDGNQEFFLWARKRFDGSPSS
ncbi:MAG: 16S/23S rRNA (cytidine-2'-O)-methyltransferase TlyA [Candidatus Methylacidiphilales bacterium]